MPLPNLLHPVTVTIERADKATTPYDPDIREPLRTARRVSVSVRAQVKYFQTGTPEWERMGFSEEVKGYLLVRKTDVDAISYVPARGDRVTAIGNRTTALYLLQWNDAGHYTDQGGYTMMRLFFTDRRPAADAPAM